MSQWDQVSHGGCQWNQVSQWDQVSHNGCHSGIRCQWDQVSHNGYQWDQESHGRCHSGIRCHREIRCHSGIRSHTAGVTVGSGVSGIRCHTAGVALGKLSEDLYEKCLHSMQILDNLVESEDIIHCKCRSKQRKEKKEVDVL